MQTAHLLKTTISQAFHGLKDVLRIARDHATSEQIEEHVFLNTRLFPDMQPMKWQVHMVTEFAARGAVRLTGASTSQLPSLDFIEETFDDLLERTDRALSIVLQTDNNSLDASGKLEIEMPFGPGQTLLINGEDYLLKMLLPNLYFHVTTAYDLLRMQGVPLGKTDYLGPIGSYLT